MTEAVRQTEAEKAPGNLFSLALGASAGISALVTVAGFVALEATSRRLGLASSLGYSVDAVANAGITFWLSTAASVPLAVMSFPGVLVPTLGIAALLGRAAVSWLSLGRVSEPCRAALSRQDVLWGAAVVMFLIAYGCIAGVLTSPPAQGTLFGAAATLETEAAYANRLGYALLGATFASGFALVSRYLAAGWPSVGARLLEAAYALLLGTLFFALAAAFGVLRGTDQFHAVTSLSVKGERGIKSGEQRGLFLLRADKEAVLLFDAGSARVLWLPKDAVEGMRLGPRGHLQ